MDKYPVMDETGKVAEWLAAGRGVRVWRSQEIGRPRSDMLTPGDATTEPHWAYKGGSTLLSADDVLFFRRVMVAADWTDTPAGWKAAERYLDGTSGDETREAPIGTVLTRYTIERLKMESDVKVHMPAIPTCAAYDRPLAVHFRVAVVSWSCIIPRQEDSQAS